MLKEDKYKNMSQKDSEYSFKVVLIGDPSVGKTSIILRFVDDQFHTELVSTNAAKTKTRTLSFGKKSVQLVLVDTVGQERFRTISRSMYREADAVIVVYDQANEKSFTSIKFWLNEVEKYASEQTRKFIVSNKSDLNTAVPMAKGKAYADELRLPFFEVSAKIDNNIDNLFQSIVQSVGERVNRSEEWNKLKIAKANGSSSSSLGGGGSSASSSSVSATPPQKKKSGFCIIL